MDTTGYRKKEYKLSMDIKSKRTLTISVSVITLLSILLFLCLKNNIFEGIGQRVNNLSGSIEGCYSPNGVNITNKKVVGSNWGGSSGITMDDGSIVLGGLDFSDRDGIKDEETRNSIKDIGFLKSNNGWNFSKFKPKITNLDRTITTCGDPTLIKLPEDGYRMYFTDGEKGCHGKAAPLLSAYSKDGYIYSFEGEITGNQGVNLETVDFTVLYEKNSHKYYIYTRADNLDEAYVLESPDGRYFTKRFKISIPFSFQFSIIDEGEYYTAYGRHIPSDYKPNSNLRYPVRATSNDGLNWQRTQDQPNGTWTGDRTYCDTYAVLKLSDGYYFY